MILFCSCRVIDLLFKPRRSKSRPPSAALSNTSQSRARTFDSSTISRKAPPILAFPSDSEQPSRASSREPVGIMTSTTTYSAMRTNVATTAIDPTTWPIIQTTPAGLHREPSSGSSTAPPRPARPKDETLEKLYYTDVASVPRVDYAGVKKEVAEMTPESDLLSEVLTAVESEYGPAILPQRRAPPPPIEEEIVENVEEKPDEADDSKATTVKDRKRFFESASGSKLNPATDKDSPGTLKRSSKGSAKGKGGLSFMLFEEAKYISSIFRCRKKACARHFRSTRPKDRRRTSGSSKLSTYRPSFG